MHSLTAPRDTKLGVAYGGIYISHHKHCNSTLDITKINETKYREKRCVICLLSYRTQRHDGCAPHVAVCVSQRSEEEVHNTAC
jgi:hypothetical protein